MPSVGSSLAIVAAAAASTCFVPDLKWVLIACCNSLFLLWVVSQLFTKSAPLESECLEERIEILPRAETTEWGSWESGPAVAEVHPGTCRSGGRASRNIICDDARLLGDVAPVLPTTATERGTISISRNPQAGELLPEGLVVNFHDDLGWDHSRLFLWPSNSNAWIVLTPDWQICGEIVRLLEDASAPLSLLSHPFPLHPLVKVKTPRSALLSSVGWTLNELSELVREGRNPAFCARTSMGLIYDRDPTMMCDLSGRFVNVPPITLGELSNVGSRDMTTRVGTSLEKRAARQRTPRVRSDQWFLCPIVFGWAWKLTELIDWDLDRLSIQPDWWRTPWKQWTSRWSADPLDRIWCPCEATFEMYKDWSYDDGRSALLYMVKHFEKHGGDGLSWLASWLHWCTGSRAPFAADLVPTPDKIWWQGGSGS